MIRFARHPERSGGTPLNYLKAGPPDSSTALGMTVFASRESF
jgi:hypothetical protein